MGGRGSSSISSMGGMSSGGGATHNQQVSFQMQQQPPQTAPTQQQAVNANNSVFADTDSSGYKDLHSGRKYFQSQNLTVSAQMAIMDYIDPNTLAGSLYSASQELNTAMATGAKLTAQQSYMENELLGAMHNLGYNLNLYRYDHSSFANKLLKSAGISANIDNASIQQLQALVGMKYNENRFTSTSYNDFKNAPSNNPFTDRQVRIVYQASANTQALMTGDTSNASGQKLSWGEILLHPNTNYEVKAVRIVGNNARKQGTQSRGYRQIEIVVEATQ